MPTQRQLIKKCRKRSRRKYKAPALDGCPQKRGTVFSITVRKPKKPNSANRPTVRVRLTNGKLVTAYVPGEAMAHHIQEHTPVLLRGGGPPDLPGVKYTVIPSGGGLIPGACAASSDGKYTKRPRRNKRRSKYGVKNVR